MANMESFTITDVMCPQCKRLRTVTFQAKARTQGDIELGIASVNARRILAEYQQKLCSKCDGSYTAKDEINCMIGTRLHSAVQTVPTNKKIEDKSNISPEARLQIAGLTEAIHYQGLHGCPCSKCVETGYTRAMERLGLTDGVDLSNIQVIKRDYDSYLVPTPRIKKRSKYDHLED